jgi:hypothetical protein
VFYVIIYSDTDLTFTYAYIYILTASKAERFDFIVAGTAGNVSTNVATKVAGTAGNVTKKVNTKVARTAGNVTKKVKKSEKLFLHLLARTAGNVATNVADIDAGTCGVCVLCDNIFSCSIKSDCAFWLQDKAMC